MTSESFMPVCVCVCVARELLLTGQLRRSPMLAFRSSSPNMPGVAFSLDSNIFTAWLLRRRRSVTVCESVLHNEEPPVFIKYDLVNAGLVLPQGGGGDVVDHLNEGQRI